MGLVLAGGGAKGAAHIGVIRVLEELGVPIDCIAGTSMGAIVGGLYAAGLSADELERAVASIDWIDIFDDDPPRLDRTFRRKRDDANFLVRYRIGLRGGSPRLPSGIILGQKLTLALRNLSLRASHVSRFDDLYIPFRAVATDLETGEEVVLDRGSLATAMRASMSIPGAFPPVAIDDRLLVDGGVTTNLPVRVARDMGAEILVVVDLPTKLATQDELGSALTILDQTLSLMILQNTTAQLAEVRPEDVVIRPELGTIGTSDFLRMLEAIEAGDRAARDAADRLRELATASAPATTAPDPEPRAVDEGRGRLPLWILGSLPGLLEGDVPRLEERRRTPPDAQPDLRIRSIYVDNESPIDDRILLARLRLGPGDPLDLAVLEEDLGAIYGLDYFDTVDYALERGGAPDEVDVIVIAREKATGLSYLRFGLELENDFGGNSIYDLALNLDMTALNAWEGEWRTEAVLGNRIRLFTEFFQPLGPGAPWFVVPKIDYLERDVPVALGGQRIAELRVRTLQAGLALGRTLGTSAEIRAGVNRGLGWTDVETGPPGIEPARADLGTWFGQIGVDTLDDVAFPRVGEAGLIRYEQGLDALGSDEPYETVRGLAGAARTWSSFTAAFFVEAGLSLDEPVDIHGVFPLGGFLRLSGFTQDELAGPNAALAKIVAYRGLPELGLELVPLYAGGSLELGNVWRDREEISLDTALVAGSLFVGADTPIGPAYVGLGYAEEGHVSAYFFLGRVF